MSFIWNSVANYYTYLFDDLSHPLTKDWFLATSPITIVAILITYNIFCIKIGPAFMKNRPPYKLDTIIKIYNIFQVFLSAYLSYEGYVYLFSGNFNWKCQGVGEGDERTARGIQLYLITKIIEFLDTIFFVLRKSDRQITFLHLYHHTHMPFITWVGLKYFPGGQGVLFGTINSVVHVVMYTYYFLSGLGPQYQKYLWWKHYLTLMQIIQFFIILVHSTISLFYPCSYLATLKVLTIIAASIFIYMFSKFYYLVYIVNKRMDSHTNNKVQQSNGSDSKSEPTSDRKTDNFDEKSINGTLNGHSGSNEVSKKNSNSNSNGASHTNGNQFSNKEKSKQL